VTELRGLNLWIYTTLTDFRHAAARFVLRFR